LENARQYDKIDYGLISSE